MTRRRTWAVVVTGVAVLTGCTGASGSVDDDTLYEQMRTVPGVESVDIAFERDPTYGPHYSGEVVLEPGLPEEASRCAIGQIKELLWQGRRTQTDGVSVVVDGQGALLVMGDLSDRFGPRPTEPRASATVSPCAAPSASSGS